MANELKEIFDNLNAEADRRDAELKAALAAASTVPSPPAPAE
jgi:hypothetical protein